MANNNPGGGSGSVGIPIKPAPKNPGGGTGSIGGPVKKPNPNPGGGTGSIGTPIKPKPKPDPSQGVVGNSGVKVPLPTTAPKPPVAVTPDTGSADQQSANAIVQDALTTYGLGSLAAWAWDKILHGEQATTILTIDIPQRQEFKDRFPGMAAAAAAGQAINPGDYVTKEKQDTELIRAAGLDVTKYASREALGNLIGNQVSTTELQNRLNLVSSAVQQTSPEARQYLNDNFGINQGNLMDYFLNPSQALPDLQLKAQAAQVGGAAQQSGFGYLDVAHALRLAGEGVTTAAAQAGFSKIAGSQQLTQNLGDGTGSVSNEDLMGAQFDQNAQAQLKAQQVVAQRVAKFQTGGGFAAGQAGVSGLGVGPQGF